MALPKPDPSRYRGGSTSSSYKQDLLNWQQTQQPTVEPVGQEEVVSLNSSFDEEPDAFAPIYTAPPVDYVPDYVEPKVEPVATASGYRETGDTTTTSDPFADYARASKEGSAFISDYGKDSEGYADALASSGLPYMDYTDEMMQDVSFQTDTEILESNKLAQQASGSSFAPMGRRISGDTEEYERAFTYNEMLNRGLDEQTAKAWYDSEGNTNEAYNLIAKNHKAKQDNYLETMSGFLESNNPDEFTKRYNESDFRGKIATANMLRKQNTISDEQFEKLYVDEWNARQEGNARPTYIVKTKAPKPPENSDQSHQWDIGDEVYTYYKPNEPWSLPDENIYIIDPSSFVPPEEDSSSPLKSLQYYDRMSPASTPTEMSSEWVQFRDQFVLPGLRTIAAVASGGMSEVAYTAARGLAGETLHGGDWATLGLAGLDAAGITTPPTEVLDPSTGQMVMSAGTGIGGLSYAQTQNLVKAAATGNPTAFLVNEFGGDIVSSALDKIGINSDNLSPEVLAGIGRTVDKLLLGEDFESALQSGVGEWARESNIGGKLEDTLRTVGRDFDDKYLQPIKDALPEGVDFPDTPEGIKAIEDAARDIGRSIADAGTPIKEGVEEIGSSIAEAAEPFKESLQETGRFIDDNLLQPAKEFVESIETPDVDLPSIDLPSIDLPSIDLPSIDLNLQLPQLAMPSATRTTDSLFSDELFKFKTKIGVSPIAPLIQTPTRRSAQAQQPSIEEYVDLFNDPFDNPFGRRQV
jgi:hypothetical protein